MRFARHVNRFSPLTGQKATVRVVHSLRLMAIVTPEFITMITRPARAASAVCVLK